MDLRELTQYEEPAVVVLGSLDSLTEGDGTTEGSDSTASSGPA